jgi:hypothetical protein
MSMARRRVKHFLWLAIFLCLAASGQDPTAQTTLFRCTSKSPKKTIVLNSSGDTVEGPICAEVSINALRFGAEFGETITETAGANLGSIFPSSFGAGGAPPPPPPPPPPPQPGVTPPPPPPPPSLEEDFQTYQRNLNELSLRVVSLQGSNRTAAASLDAALRSLREFVIQSDMTFTNKGSTGVIALVKSDAFQNALNEALGQQAAWATSDQLIDALRGLQVKLNALPVQHPANTEPVTADYCTPANINKLGWTDWDTRCRDAEYKQTLATLAQTITDASVFSSDGDRAAAIAKKIGVATYWKTTSEALSGDDFVRQFETSCPALFNRNRQVALKLVLTDRVPTFDLQAMTTTTKDNLLLAQCGSRFSISAGAAFSGIPNTEFAIVKGTPTAPATTSTNRFGILSDPTIHPVPMAIVHARLADTPGHAIALHGSFGIGVNTRSQSSGGSSPEFLLGPSLSFLRTIYITAGLEIGTTTDLAGGFKVNDPVPSDVTAPQIVTSYIRHWGVAVTFTKP